MNLLRKLIIITVCCCILQAKSNIQDQIIEAKVIIDAENIEYKIYTAYCPYIFLQQKDMLYLTYDFKKCLRYHPVNICINSLDKIKYDKKLILPCK